MNSLHVSEHEVLLLNAALNPDAGMAAEAWRNWASARILEEAPYPELRMLPAVHARLSEVAPDLALPQKLRGKARATFTRNQLLAHGSLPALTALAAEMPVMLIKGAAFCARFGTWSSRAMGDIDILLPTEHLSRAGEILASAGWTPKYGMTWASMTERTALRRNSWNVIKANADVDVHWRYLDDVSGGDLDRQLWATADRATFFGLDVLVPDPEFAVVTALRHGFLEGSHGDRLQTALDVSAYLPSCDDGKLAALITATGLWDACVQLRSVFTKAGSVCTLPARSVEAATPGVNAPKPGSIPPSAAVERSLLHRPGLYRLWERLGRRARLERLFIRLFGPFSKPLAQCDPMGWDFDLRNCSTIDEVAGPGWGWPEPEHSCFWTDRADCRLLLPVPSPRNVVVVLSLSALRHYSPNDRVSVFANGCLIAQFDLTDHRRQSGEEHALLIPGSVMFGPWVELSFRPDGYKGDLNSGLNYGNRRSIPAARIRVFDALRLGHALASNSSSPFSFRVLSGEEPYVSRFARIKDKIAQSPYRNDPALPADFDPIFYVLWYDDLFNAEVDPFEHFLSNGRAEGRSWR